MTFQRARFESITHPTQRHSMKQTSSRYGISPNANYPKYQRQTVTAPSRMQQETTPPMDGTSPQNKNSTTPPAPGNAIPAPGGAIPAPKPTEQEAAIPPVSANPPAPGNAIPAPGGSVPAPGGSVPAPGSSVPAPGGSVPAPGASTPSIPTAPGGAVPVPSGLEARRPGFLAGRAV